MTNNANAAQAQKNRDFQADQTGTAYQRAVKDLQAAGLNPMLAYTNGGASSGSGAQAVMQNAVGSAIHTGMSAKMNAAQVDNLVEQNDLIKAQKVQALSTSDLNNALASKAVADARLSSAAAKNESLRSRIVSNDADTSDVTRSVYKAVAPFISSAADAVRNSKPVFPQSR